MKLCVFAKGLPHSHIKGGMEIHTYELIRRLSTKGLDITVITTKHPQNLKFEILEEGIEVFYVGDIPLKYTPKFYLESWKLFEKLHFKKEFDIIHSQSIAGFGFVKYGPKNMPFVITSHGTTVNEFRSALNSKEILKIFNGMLLALRYFFNSTEKKSFLRANKIIAVSKDLAQIIKEFYKVPSKKLIVIHNGVDHHKFRPRDASHIRLKLRIDPDEKIILLLGRILKEKGFHLVLRILPKLVTTYKVKVVIVGDGPYLDVLKKLAKDLKISAHVVFLGKVPHELIPLYYNLADIVVLPSQRVEGLPLVLLEAMASEKPVVASKIGGITEVIHHMKDGILVDPRSLKDLENGIRLLLEDEALARYISKNARRKILEGYTVDYMVEKTIEVYKSIL